MLHRQVMWSSRLWGNEQSAPMALISRAQITPRPLYTTTDLYDRGEKSPTYKGVNENMQRASSTEWTSAIVVSVYINQST